MSLVVIASGVFSTVQDLGRRHSRSRGVPVGGAFDQASAQLANALVGNPARCAVLEMTYIGGTYEAITPIALALCGAPMRATRRSIRGADVVLEPPVSFFMRADDQLVLGPCPKGARTYLAVRGGWQTPEILGSRSSETPLKAGDVLPCIEATTPRRRLVPPEIQAPFTLRITDGPDAAMVDSSWVESDRTFKVDARSDRMGVRLDGPRCVVKEDHERLSTPVAPGAVQMAGGLPLILGVACGTMGGYPHVAQVISADLPKLAQIRPGDPVRFERVSLAEARRLHTLWRDDLHGQCLAIRAAVSDGTYGLFHLGE